MRVFGVTIRKKGRPNGFTLVEVIVVLVILAILAAILIPSMVQWIDKANEKRLIVACRTCVNAAQTLASEAYGKNGQAVLPTEADILALADLEGSVSGLAFVANSAQIRHLTYSDGTDSVTYCFAADDHPEHYNFTAGGPSLTPNQAAVQMQSIFAAMKQVNPASLGNVSDVYSNVMTPESQAFFNQLPANVQTALTGKTWMVSSGTSSNLANTDSYRLVVYDGDLDAVTPRPTQVSIVAYDLSNGNELSYTKAYVGTKAGYDGRIMYYLH